MYWMANLIEPDNTHITDAGQNKERGRNNLKTADNNGYRSSFSFCMRSGTG